MNIQAEKFLSKNDIERIAQPIVEMYKLACVPQYRMCYNVDPIQLADVLGLLCKIKNAVSDSDFHFLLPGEEKTLERMIQIYTKPGKRKNN